MSRHELPSLSFNVGVTSADGNVLFSVDAKDLSDEEFIELRGVVKHVIDFLNRYDGEHVRALASDDFPELPVEAPEPQDEAPEALDEEEMVYVWLSRSSLFHPTWPAPGGRRRISLCGTASGFLTDDDHVGQTPPAEKRLCRSCEKLSR